MVHAKRFLFIMFIFAASMVLIHTSRARHVVPSKITTVCMTPENAQKMSADEQLKWKAQIAYDTKEADGAMPSYRCYISFPKSDTVCAPRNVNEQSELKTCPGFPSLISKKKTCYFLNTQHHDLARRLSMREPRMSMKDLNGVVVDNLQAAKNTLLQNK